MIEELYDVGINVSAAKERFLNNEEVYEKHLYKFPYNVDYQKSFEYIKAGDYENAFFNMHNFKCTCGNLSLYKVYEISSEVVDELRLGKLPSENKQKRLMTEYDKICNIIRKLEKSKTNLFSST